MTDSGRQDPLRFVAGHGAYVDDLRFEEMLHLHMIRSPYARARIVKVEGGINHREMKANVASVGEGADGKGPKVLYPALAGEIVQYVGQPVAAVLGSDRYEAEDLAGEVQVDYEPLKPAMDPEKAIDAEPIHAGTKSNVFSSKDLGSKFEAHAPVIVEDELINERVSPNPIETRGLVTSFKSEVLTVYGSTQSVHAWKDGFSSSLNLPPEKVRVVQMDTGGAFGCKGGVYPEYLVAAYASIKTKKPVKWVETRYEHLLATEQGRGVKAKLKLHSDRKGRVLGLEGVIIADVGAFPLGAWVSQWVGFQITGPYAIKNVSLRALSVCTNKVPLGPYRGAGRPEAAFFTERMMDLLADELKMDPADVRRANASEKPFESPLGLKIDPFRPFLESALRELDYSRRLRRDRYVGLSCFVLVPAMQPGESAKVAVRDGRLKVWLGGSASGQNHEIFAGVIIDKELGVKETQLDFERGDTVELGEGVGTWGSRSAILGGAALIEAAKKLRAMVRAPYSPEKLLLSSLSAEAFFKSTASMNSFGANLAVVEKRDDVITPVEVTAFYDVGTPLSLPTVEGQIVGGSIQGVGQVLHEQMPYDEDGQLLVGGIADAGVPGARESPKVVVKLADSRSSLPHGAKGLGESPTIGVPPALIRALELAAGRKLRRTAVDPSELTCA